MELNKNTTLYYEEERVILNAEDKNTLKLTIMSSDNSHESVHLSINDAKQLSAEILKFVE